MIYLIESKLPENMSIFFALQQIYGIGKNNSFFICKKLGFSINLKVKNLSKNQTTNLLNLIESLNLIIGSDLKKFNNLIMQNLISIKSYKGTRKLQGLPVRGQRTHTNARTARKKLI